MYIGTNVQRLLYMKENICKKKTLYLSEFVIMHVTRFWDRMKELQVANAIALCNADRRHSDMAETEL